MYPVSPDFIQAIRNGAVVKTVIDVYKPGGNEPWLEDVPIENGSITSDPDAAIRRRVTLNIDLGKGDSGLYVPAGGYDGDHGLWPAGLEANIRQGVVLRPGPQGTEWVNLGWFILSRPRVHDDGSNFTLSIEGADLSKKINRASLVDAFDIGFGTPMTYAVTRILMYALPTLGEEDFDFSLVVDDPGMPHLTLTAGGNPWDVFSKITRSHGYYMDISVDRKVRMRIIPRPGVDDPIIAYEEDEYNIVDKIERELDEDSAINGVIVVGGNPSVGNAIRGEAWNKNPLHPLYYDPASPGASKVGPHIQTMNVNWVADQNQADAVAEFELFRLGEVAETVSLSAAPMFCHEPFDIVRLHRARAGIGGDYILHSMQLGLGAKGSLDVTTRQPQLALLSPVEQ